MRKDENAVKGLVVGDDFPSAITDQINTVVPAGVETGNDVPVVITVAGQVSPPVTMAIR